MVILGVVSRSLLYLALDDVALVGQCLYLVLHCCDLSAVLGGFGGIEFCICRLLCFVVLILLLKESLEDIGVKLGHSAVVVLDDRLLAPQRLLCELDAVFADSFLGLVA